VWGTDLKLKIRLKSVTLFFFIVIACVITLSGINNYINQNKLVTENFVNKHTKTVQQTREFYRLKFDKLQHDFVSKEEENIAKISLLYDRYKRDRNNIDVQLIAKELNRNINAGYYEVFLINNKNIIEKTSYLNDLGYNLGAHKEIADILDSLFNKNIQIDVSPIQIDSASMSFKRYILKRSDDGRYLLQIAFVLDFEELFREILPFPHDGGAFKIHLANNNLIQPIRLNRINLEKKTLSDGWIQTKSFLEEMSKALALPKKHIVNDLLSRDIAHESLNINRELEGLFSNRDVMSNLDLPNGILSVYSATNSLFNKNSETKLLLNTQFPTKELDENLNEAFYYTLIPVLFSLISLSFIYVLLIRNVLTPLINIIADLRQNQRTNVEDSFISEISMLSYSYNRLHDTLNTEVKKNNDLLKYNRSCIADTIHQIKTPLTNILMNGEMIKSASDRESLVSYIDRIDSSINMISNSYDDLSYAITSDTIEYTPTEIDLGEILKQRILFFKTISQSTFKIINYKIDDNIKVIINQIELERIIDNNLSNAIKYADAHQSIIVSLTKHDATAALKFESFGTQIVNKDKIFDEGYRENHGKRGLGLGLSMVKRICSKYEISYFVSYANQKNIFTYQFRLQ